MFCAKLSVAAVSINNEKQSKQQRTLLFDRVFCLMNEEELRPGSPLANPTLSSVNTADYVSEDKSDPTTDQTQCPSACLKESAHPFPPFLTLPQWPASSKAFSLLILTLRHHYLRREKEKEKKSDSRMQRY